MVISPEKGLVLYCIANALVVSIIKLAIGLFIMALVGIRLIIRCCGKCNGKLGAVILYGNEIQVGNGDTWTVEQRIVNIYAELNNRYTKAQTYSNTKFEQRITDLLGLANLQDTAIEKSAGVYTFDNGDSILASSLAQYNWVITKIL